MKIFELVTLNLTFAGLASAAESATRFATAPDASGTLLACWRPEIGPLNKLVLFRMFESFEGLMNERVRTSTSSNPFFCGSNLTGLDMHSYAAFPGFEDVPLGSLGPYYEIRTYQVKPGGLRVLMPDWAAIAPARSRFSKLLMAMYALDGTLRMTHIWPYSDLNTRIASRDAATTCEGWPPSSGLQWLDPLSMRSEIYLPAPGSPLK